MSPITTHVLNTSSGKPAEGVSIKLETTENNVDWKHIAEGITNSDGRIMDLLDDDFQLTPGVYQITFQTGDYFKNLNPSRGFP